MVDLAGAPTVGASTLAFARSAVTTVWLLLRGRLRLPDQHVGGQVHFGDHTVSEVFRETVRLADVRRPSVLVIRFQLRLVDRPLLHAIFRAESILNTPLFAGFPGFRTKLWLTDRHTGVYRGVYDWDGPERAVAYAESLTALLRPFCIPGSVAFRVEPGLRREELFEGVPPDPGEVGWWRPVAWNRDG
jgi:hypothetical protein